jgi:hypothetical protein
MSETAAELLGSDAAERPLLAACAATMSENISVFARLRPARNEGFDACVTIDPTEDGTIHHAESRAYSAQPLSSFRFHSVFGPDVGQAAIFETVALPVCASVLRGCHGAVLAYGQTASGKTHTIDGTADDPGLVPRILDHFLQQREQMSGHEIVHELRLSVSYIEVYNERIYDLLEVCDVCGGPTDEPQCSTVGRYKWHFACGHTVCAGCAPSRVREPALAKCPCCAKGALKCRKGVVSGLACVAEPFDPPSPARCLRSAASLSRCLLLV